MKMKKENKKRAVEFLVRSLDFYRIETPLLHHGFITSAELMNISNFLQRNGKNGQENNIVMNTLVERFLISDDRTALIIQILQDTKEYQEEAIYLSQYLECQKSNARVRNLFIRDRPYYFPEENKSRIEKSVEKPTLQDHNLNAFEVNTCGFQEIEKSKYEVEKGTNNIGTESIASAHCSDTCPSAKTDGVYLNSIQQVEGTTVNNDGMDSITSSMSQVVVTPMGQADENIAAVFHQVKDYEDMSDMGNVDEANVYEIAKKIGVPIVKIKGRIQTNRIGKAKKQITRPLKVTFRDEKTRDSFVKMAKENADILDTVNIVPFKKEKRRPYWFGKKNSREKQNKNSR